MISDFTEMLNTQWANDSKQDLYCLKLVLYIIKVLSWVLISANKQSKRFYAGCTKSFLYDREEILHRVRKILPVLITEKLSRVHKTHIIM